MDMQRYALEAKARSDELLELVPDDRHDMLWAWMITGENVDLEGIIRAPDRHVLKVLGMTTKQRLDWRERSPPAEFLRQWIAARHWAVLSAKVLDAGVDPETVNVRSYKGVHQWGAQEACRRLPPQCLSTTLFCKWGVL